MKKIKLTQQQFAIVDKEDFEYLSRFKWHALKLKRGFVACRMGKRPNRKRIYMHREIMNCENDMLIDHINHNTLDNRKLNLRKATYAENRHNSRSNKNSSSSYIGVSYHKRDKCYRAQIAINGKQVEVGRSKCEKEAAKIYNRNAKKYYGNFAFLNKL